MAEVTCPTCNGRGTVDRHYVDKKGISRKETVTCGQCGGSGTISIPDKPSRR